MKKYNYYKDQIEKINPKSSVISIKITDFDGNETKNFSLNKESIPELKKLISKILKNTKKGD